MICKQCNNNVPNDSEYCPFCGNFVEKEITQANNISDVEKGYTYLELKEWKKAKEIFDFAIVNNDNKARAYIGRLLAKLKLSDLIGLSSVNKTLTKFDDFKMAVKYADDNYKEQLKKYYSLVEDKINQKKVKTKKRAIISLISSMSLIVLLVLTYFVFIPLGRFSYYQNLLSNEKIEKATKSYSDSKWFEFDEKAEELFYNKGVSLVESKDYKNAELCFDTTKNFKDSKNYYNYCKAQNLLAENDLESYNYFMNCKDFLNSKEILNKNEYFVLLNKLQGEWYHPEKSLEEIDLEMKKLGFRIDESAIRYSLGFKNWVEMIREYGYTYSERYRKEAQEQTITFSGTTCIGMGKIVINREELCVIGADDEIYKDKFIEFLDDENINFAYFKWEKK